MKLLVQLACLALFGLSLASYFGTVHPYFEMLAHFKLQFCLLLSLVVGLQLLMRCRGMFVLGLVFLAMSLWEVLPWYLPASSQSVRSQPQSQNQLKVLLANVLFSNHQVSPLQKLIQDEAPDLVVLQEANVDLLQMMSYFRQQLPYHFRARNLPYGLAVWSRYPISQPQFWLLAGKNLPSLSGTIHLGARTLEIFTTHLTSPIREPVAERDRQLEALGSYLRQHPEIDLVLGDMNISMWSPAYRRFAKSIQLHNCRQGFGILPSWPSQLPNWARIPIDQCLAAPGIQIQDFKLGANIGSDHLPLLLTLAM